jgi:hypothetical protein
MGRMLLILTSMWRAAMCSPREGVAEEAASGHTRFAAWRCQVAPGHGGMDPRW